MKRYASETYRAMMLSGYGYLAKEGNNPEEVKNIIDMANARAVRMGYEPESYIITCTEYYVYYDEDGTFVSRETYESVCEGYEKYPL